MENQQIDMHFKRLLFRQIYGFIKIGYSKDMVMKFVENKIKEDYPNITKESKETILEITKAIYFLYYKLVQLETLLKGGQNE